VSMTSQTLHQAISCMFGVHTQGGQLGLFSLAQMYVLDEFCARYGVRDPFRHLTCLQDWLDCLEKGMSIWPVMIKSSFRFCQMHIMK